MTVLQIYGRVPAELKSCVDSVKAWAKANGFDYVKESLPKSGYKYTWRSTVSDIVRAEYLATYKNTLYVDWDIVLYDSFQIPDPVEDVHFGIHDCIIWNGQNTDFFKDALERYREYEDNHPQANLERGRMWKIYKGNVGPIRFDPMTYRHLCWHKHKGA